MPYRGTAMAVQDVIAGQVPMMVLDTAAGLPQIRSGKVKALAVMSRKRIAALPDVPTLDELGIKDFEVTAWQGLFVPKGTPAEIVARPQRRDEQGHHRARGARQAGRLGLECCPATARRWPPSSSRRPASGTRSSRSAGCHAEQ